MKRGYMRGFVAGIVLSVSTLMIVGTAFATVGSNTLIADYNDIKIELNGEKITPQDAQGNPVEPFAVNGTIYLPVRAVGTALGLDVEWDGTTNTVKLSTERTEEKSESQEILYYPHSRVPMLENVIFGHYEDSTDQEEGANVYTYTLSQFSDYLTNLKEYVRILLEQKFEYLEMPKNEKTPYMTFHNIDTDEGVMILLNDPRKEHPEMEPEIMIFVFYKE